MCSESPHLSHFTLNCFVSAEDEKAKRRRRRKEKKEKKQQKKSAKKEKKRDREAKPPQEEQKRFAEKLTNAEVNRTFGQGCIHRVAMTRVH